MENPAWLTSPDRNCADVDVGTMYPPEGDERAEAIARSICTDCVFVDLCRDYAIRMHEQGTWGATTPKDRRTIMRKIQRNNSGNRNKRAD